MRKSIVKVFLMVLTLTLCMTLTVSVASSKSNEKVLEKKVDDSGQEYYLEKETGERIIGAMAYNDKGELVEIDLDDAIAHYISAQNMPSVKTTKDVPVVTEEVVQEEAVAYSPLPITLYSYTENSNTWSSGTLQKVSADHIGPCDITAESAVSNTKGFDVGLSLTASVKDAIEGGASFGFNKSVSSSTSISSSFPVPAGETGYVVFSQYWDNTYGTLTAKTYRGGFLLNTSNYAASGRSPRKLSNGFADGIYFLKLR